MNEDQKAVREKKNAATLSMIAALFLTGIKLTVGLSTNSLGVLAEAAHSALDLLAAGLTFFAVRMASKPADKTHTYGHGKIENISALAETLLLLITCVWIVYEAVGRLIHDHAPVRLSIFSILVMVVAIVVDFTRARHLSRVAKKYNSQALEADALHFSTDILSSLVVIFGLIAVWCARFAPADSIIYKLLIRADSCAALVVAFIVVVISLRLGGRAVNQLLDSANANDLQKVESAVLKVNGVVKISRLRYRQSGADVFIDMSITLPFDWDLQQAHALTEEVENTIREILPAADINIHYEPDTTRDLMGMVRNFAHKRGIDVHALKIFRTNHKTLLTVHVEMDGQMPLREAYKRVKNFETDLSVFQSEILTHIEPRQQNMKSRAELINSEQTACGNINVLIENAIKNEPGITNLHSVNWIHSEDNQILCLHCCVNGSATVEETHRMTMKLEKLIHESCGSLSEIIVHAQPEEETPEPSSGC